MLSRAAAVLSLVLFATSARAAHVTDVADAMDEVHPLEVDLDVGYVHRRSEVRITRETPQAAGGASSIQLVDELHHLRTVDELGFRLGVGLYHDLELHALVPLVLRDQQDWRYANSATAATSTLANNHLDISGCGGAGSCSASGPASPIVPLAGGQSLRTGLRDPTIGISWGPVNEERELRLKPEVFPEGKPVATWVIGFDYTLPLPGPVSDPSIFGAAASPPGAGPKGRELLHAHRFELWTAFSKRYRVLEPYVSVRASAPLVQKGSKSGDGAYDNCWHPESLADVAAVNCADAAWKGQTGYQPPYQGGFALGTELVLYEDRAAGERFAFDVRGETTYFSPSRDYTQLADALGKLTYSEEYVNATGSLGFYARLANWLHARVYGTLGMDTPHFLTAEAIGQDVNGDGQIVVSAGKPGGSIEQNPTYDFRLDQVGRRLHAEASLNWGVSGTLSLNF